MTFLSFLFWNCFLAVSNTQNARRQENPSKKYDSSDFLYFHIEMGNNFTGIFLYLPLCYVFINCRASIIGSFTLVPAPFLNRINSQAWLQWISGHLPYKAWGRWVHSKYFTASRDFRFLNLVYVPRNHSRYAKVVQTRSKGSFEKPVSTIPVDSPMKAMLFKFGGYFCGVMDRYNRELTVFHIIMAEMSLRMWKNFFF